MMNCMKMVNKLLRCPVIFYRLMIDLKNHTANSVNSENQMTRIENQLSMCDNGVKDIIKNQILSRWQMVDALDSLRFPDSYEVKCGICGYSNKKNTFEKKISQCIFNGGTLERFVCPACGVIFGPLKISCMNEAQLAEEYRQSYSVFSEGDSTEAELNTFYSIAKDKNGVYLNFGAGAWSKTEKKIRNAGYIVYNYDPYAPASHDEWLITDKDCLKNMKFDGIFSNNLLEHLQNPIETLIFMKSLLRDEKSQMAHSTPCYQYLYEYTRFHLFFYTGTSLPYLCNKIGLEYTMQPVHADNPHYMNCIFSNSKIGRLQQ